MEGESRASFGGVLKAARYRTFFFIAIALLILALAAVVVLAVLLAQASNDSYESSRRLLLAIDGNPGEMLYILRESDGSGALLQSAMDSTRGKNPGEFDGLVEDISTKLMGEDQMAFFTSENAHGVENARILGYFNGCLQVAGVDEQPYPKNADGSSYDGASEVPFEQEFNSVVGEAKAD